MKCIQGGGGGGFKCLKASMKLNWNLCKGAMGTQIRHLCMGGVWIFLAQQHKAVMVFTLGLTSEQSCCSRICSKQP